MRSRRRFWVIVAVVAGAALVVLGRPGGDDEPESPAAERPPAAVNEPTAADRPAEPASETAPTSPAPEPVEPVEPDGASGVVGEEALDPSAVAGARQAAEQFAAIWAASDPQWHDQLAGLATPALAASLADAEPPAAPGYRITGDAEVYFDAPEWARIGVPADRGIVVVDVVAVDGLWLVSAVDWRPS